MVRNLLIILQLVSLSLTMPGQENKPCPCNYNVNEILEPKLAGEIYYPEAGIVGDEFFNVNYVEGDIILQDGAIASDKQIRYNGRIDGLLYLPSKSSREILLDKYFIKEFCLKNYGGNSKLCFKKIKVSKEFNEDSVEVFGQLLYQNKTSLYAFRQCIYNKDVITYVKNEQIMKKSYISSTIYYFQLPNHRTISFKSFKKRDLLKSFPANKDLMKKLFREKHQRRYKSEEDLIRITEILNSLFN